MRGSWVRALTAATLTVSGLALTQGTAVAQGPGDVAVATRVAAMTDPVVQLITNDYQARVVVPRATMKKAFDKLMAKARRHAKARRIPADNQSQIKWVLRTALADVDRYLAPTKRKRTVKVGTGNVCTGWWVTPNGHMVTNAHCIDIPDPELRKDFATQALPLVTEGDVNRYLTGIMKVAQPDDELVTLAEKLFGSFNEEHMRIKGLQQKISLVRPRGKDKLRFTPLKVIAQGQPFPDVDFALLKMNGERNLPTATLGSDTDLQVGDTIYLNGFPGLTTSLNPIVDLRSRLYPSHAEGPFNARRTTIAGVPYIHAQVPAYGGNSGGPAFGKDGKVIGMVTAVAADDRIGGHAENQSYILPVSIIKKRLAAAGVKPVTSATSKYYRSALNDFFARRYTKALPKFLKVRKLYPRHPYVGTFITDTRKAIAASKNRSR